MGQRASGGRRCVVLLCLLHAVVALTLGLGYYLLRRPDAFLTRVVAAYLRIDVATPPGSGDGLLLRLIDGHLADFLWAYALTFSVNAATILLRQPLWRTFVMALAADCAMELFQGFGLMSGTFDVWDIMFQIAATIVVQMITLRMTKGGERREQS